MQACSLPSFFPLFYWSACLEASSLLTVMRSAMYWRLLKMKLSATAKITRTSTDHPAKTLGRLNKLVPKVSSTSLYVILALVCTADSHGMSRDCRSRRSLLSADQSELDSLSPRRQLWSVWSYVKLKLYRCHLYYCVARYCDFAVCRCTCCFNSVQWPCYLSEIAFCCLLYDHQCHMYVRNIDQIKTIARA